MTWEKVIWIFVLKTKMGDGAKPKTWGLQSTQLKRRYALPYRQTVSSSFLQVTGTMGAFIGLIYQN